MAYLLVHEKNDKGTETMIPIHRDDVAEMTIGKQYFRIRLHEGGAIRFTPKYRFQRSKIFQWFRDKALLSQGVAIAAENIVREDKQ